MVRGLISIITPCFNTGKYVSHLLDSILNQSYKSVEMIVVDDGSTDNTKQVVLNYKKKFEDKGYSFKYIFQDNSGQSVALNRALKLVKGEYLLWPDSDDYYVDTNLFVKMVSALSGIDNNTSMVRCLPSFVNEEYISTLHKVKNKSSENLFEDCLFVQNGFWFPPICYMARMSSIDSLIPNREIYTEKNAGQNWQIMLPLLYKKKCYTIPSFSVNILERKKSHSRGFFAGYERQIQKLDVYERTILSTLEGIIDMNYSEKNIYKAEIKYQYLQKRMLIALQFNNKEGFDVFYAKLPLDRKNIKNRVMKILIHFPFGFVFYKVLSKFWKK